MTTGTHNNQLQNGRGEHRVVITGMGWVTPLGHDIESVWHKLLSGASGIDRITHFDAGMFPSTFAGQVRNYDYNQFVKSVQWHEGVGLNTSFALGAAAQAWADAGLESYDDLGKLNHERLGIYLGAGEGSIDFDNYAASNLAGWNTESKSIDTINWAAFAKERMIANREIEQEPNMPLAHLAMEFEVRGPTYNCLTACAASTQAIGEASQILRRGDADIMITGGTHTMIHPLGVTGFNRLTALSTHNENPQGASRPFSIDRDGFVLGEGSGILIIETLEHALKRGARIHAEIKGYGSTADAYRTTDIQPEGRGAGEAIRHALQAADIDIQSIDYISAHGTGTRENDSIETVAVKAVFGDRAKTIPISSIKSMMGHLIAAAGSVEAITCVLAIRDQKLPPTINLNRPDPECDLDYVPNQSRDARIETCLSNSFGFGGQNNTLVIQRYR